MKNAGTVLIYNCSGPKFSKLRQIFAMLRLKMRPVTPDKYHLTVRELADGVGEPSAEAPEAFGENMLVFCYMNSALLNQVLEIIRLGKFPPIPLKAVLTEANQDWNSVQLHQELLQEHEALSKE